MTSDENPADTVIEQAARRLAWAMADADGIHPGDFETDPFDDLTDDAQRDVLAFAHALHDAGLLVDPADRDVKARLIAHRNVLRRMNRAEAEVADLVAEGIRQKRRANDAIAERDELRATVARVRAIHEPIDAVMNPGPRERIVKVCTGCGTDDGNWQRWPCPTVRALDGEGEQ